MDKASNITVILPYANPHVLGWVDELKKNRKISIRINAVESVEKFRAGYFLECDFIDDINYFFKFPNNKSIYYQSLANSNVLLTLGLFYKDFLKSLLYISDDCHVVILTEPLQNLTIFRRIKYLAVSLAIKIILKRNKISFMAIGGRYVKDCYTKVGFRGYPFYNFGYFPQSEFKQKEKKLSDKIKFLFIGQLIERKGIPVLLNFVKYLSTNYTHWSLTIIGDGEYREEIRVLSHDHEQVSYLGLISDQKLLQIEYEQADVFFLPSYFDGWGAVVQEALANSCSLLISEKVFSAVNLVRNGRNGFTFNPYNLNDLFEKTDKYFNDLNIINLHIKNSKAIYNEWNEVNAAESFVNFIHGEKNINKSLMKKYG